MKRSGSARSFITELMRYFGFPVFAVIVVVIAFFATKYQIESEIHEGTFQILQDSTRTQRIALERHVDLLTTRVTLVADYNSDTGPNTLVEALRTEMLGDANDAEIGYANEKGILFYSDKETFSVAHCDWFQRSIRGETVITTASMNLRDGLTDVLISAIVHPKTGEDGVLFITLDNKYFSRLLTTHAYDGTAFSLVTDEQGTVLFSEDKEDILQAGTNLFELVNDQTLDKDYRLAQLTSDLGRQSQIRFHFNYNEETYHAICEATGVCGWYIITMAPGSTADYIQHQVSVYQTGMLFIMLVVGISLSVQSYLHERATVRKIEKDRDLLQQSAQRYQLLSQLSNEVFFHIDRLSGEVLFNENFDAMFGFSPPACSIEKMDACYSLFLQEDRMRFRATIQGLINGATEAYEELRMVDSRGMVRWKRLEIFAVLDQNGQAVEFVGKIADIHRQKKSMQKLIQQADSDPLTNLLNRGALERSVKEFLSGEGKNGKHALLFLDFDRFKAVNDTLGHATGDKLLADFAARMKRLFRAGDYLSRTGGDEYMVFLKDIEEDGVALEKAEALCTEMADLSRKIGITVSVSVGVAIYDRDGDTFEKLYRAADKALYQVKQKGKNSISFFSAPEKHTPEDGVQTEKL